MMCTSSAYIDYYKASDGETIIIAPHSKERITSLKESVKKLFDGEIETLDICKLANTRCSNTICELKLINVAHRTSPGVTVDHTKTCFSWRQDCEELEKSIGLIDGLIVHDRPGHQYFADELDYIIESSYNKVFRNLYWRSWTIRNRHGRYTLSTEEHWSLSEQ